MLWPPSQGWEAPCTGADPIARASRPQGALQAIAAERGQMRDAVPRRGRSVSRRVTRWDRLVVPGADRSDAGV